MIGRLVAGVVDRLPPGLVERAANAPRVQRAFRPLANRVLSREPTAVTVRGGRAKDLRLVIDPQSEKFLWSGIHEPHVHEVLARELKPGMRFWDVGAHVGYFSLQASRLVGAEGRVIAFEPIDENAARLRRSVELNCAANIVVIGEALAADRGPAQMFKPGTDSFTWMMGADGDDHLGGRLVAVSTLDSHLERFGVPDLVKVDAEGAEVAVLEGGPDLIKEGRTMFLIEFTGPEMVGEARGLMSGYSLELIDGNHWLAQPAGSGTRPS